MNAIKIEKLVFGGYGLGRGGGGVVLIPETAAGEVVEYEDDGYKGGTALGRVTSIVERSPKRREPPCPHYLECGGCDWLHLLYDEQVRCKKEIFLDCIDRIGKFDHPREIDIFTDSEFGYRMRAQIKIDHKNKHAGFFRRKTNDVVRVDKCPLLVDEINEVLAKLNSGMINIIPDDVKVIKILSGNNTASDPVIDGLTNSTATVIVQNHPLSVIASEAKQSRNGLSTSIPASGLLRRYAPRNDVNVNPNEQSGTIQFLVNGNSFFQSNRFLLEKLGNWAHGSIGGGYCLDLYGGIGFFSLMLGDDFESVVLVENVAAQVSAAQKNFEINGKNHIKAILADVEKEGSLDKLVTPRKPDCVIIDPPRPGLTKSVRKWLVDTMPPIILYISCNPSTFARDAGALVRGGYKLSQWALFDLYPNTHHIESAAMFTRRN